MTTQRIVVPVYGLDCGGGVVIERALLGTPGVVRAYVNSATELAYVDCDPERADPKQLAAAIARAGFRVGEPSLR